MADKYDSWFGKFVGLLNGSKRFAITIGQTSYFSVPKWEVGDKWQLHEDTHKQQYANDGFFRFIFNYLFYSIKFGYKNNPYEVEAREVAKEI